MCFMLRLWEFQNGKMGVYRQKINKDTVKNVKDQILINSSFHKEKHEFCCKNCNFPKSKFSHFLLYLG